MKFRPFRQLSPILASPFASRPTDSTCRPAHCDSWLKTVFLPQTAAACSCAEAQTKWSIHFISILSANALPNAIRQGTGLWVMPIVLLSVLLLIMPRSARITTNSYAVL